MTTYSKKFGDHNFKVMAGFNQESSYQETLDAYSYNQAVIDVPAMGSGTGTIKATDSYSEYAVRGGFFRVNYNYQDKYLLDVMTVLLNSRRALVSVSSLLYQPVGRSLRRSLWSLPVTGWTD